MTPTYWFIAGVLSGWLLKYIVDKIIAAICEAWKY